MARYRAVIFDLDGTLVDSYEPITVSLNAARAHFGLPPVSVDQVRREVGHGLEALVALHLGEERVAEGVRVFRETYARVFREGMRPIPGAVEAARELARRGLALAVCSNKPSRFGRPILDAVGLGPEVVPVVLGPEDGVPTKPEPPMLRRAMELLGVPPEDTVYVGDMPLDVESARRADSTHFLVPTGSATLEQLVATPGARIVMSHDELVRQITDPFDQAP